MVCVHITNSHYSLLHHFSSHWSYDTRKEDVALYDNCKLKLVGYILWIAKVTVYSNTAITTWYLWPDLRKGAFHTHPIHQIWQSITSDWKQPFPWNLNSSEYQHRSIDVENFSFVCALKPKLQSSKFIELDVCGRPLFANPVTFANFKLENYLNFLVTIKKYSKMISQALTCKVNQTICKLLKFDNI